MPVPLLMSAAIAIASEFFPDLVNSLRRPGGRVLAASVVEAAAAAAGVSPSSDPGQIIARVKESPKAVEDLRLELEQIDADKEIYLAEISDRANARQSEIDRGGDARARGNWMIAGVALGLAACIYAAIHGLSRGQNGTLDPGVLALITTVAGALLKMLSDAFAYEFGSSRGSKEKTIDLMDLSRSNQSATARAVQSAQTQAAAVAKQVVRETKSAMTTGAAAATVAAEAVATAAKPRDFVGQLVRGEI